MQSVACIQYNAWLVNLVSVMKAQQSFSILSMSFYRLSCLTILKMFACFDEKSYFFNKMELHHTLLFICINMTYFSWKMDWVKRSCKVPTPITRSIPPWLLPLGHLKSVVYKNRPCNFDLKDAITTERQKVNSETINKVKNS